MASSFLYKGLSPVCERQKSGRCLISIFLACTALLVHLSAVPTAAAAVYKCTDAKGSTSFSDVPCPNAERVETQVNARGGGSVPSSDTVPGVPAPGILSAVYVSPRNGHQLDVTNQLRAGCSNATTGSCLVVCSNGLAGDPDFGQRKLCRISYQCSGHAAKNVEIQEGETAALNCPSNRAPRVPELAVRQSPGKADKAAVSAALTVVASHPSPAVSGTRPAFGSCPASETAGGGLLLSGLTVGTPPLPAFLRLVAPSGHQVWQAQVPTGIDISCVHVERGGDFWVTGSRYLRDVKPGTLQPEYVIRIGRDGEFSPPVQIGRTDRPHFPNCGIETDGGFVLAGTNAHNEYLVPWIGMIDRGGHVIWERSFPQDEGKLLTIWGAGSERCAGLRMTVDGLFVWSTEVGVSKSTEDIGKLGGINSGVLTVVLDRQGNVLHRARDTEVRWPLLALTHDRIIVYAMLAPGIPPPPKTQADAIRQLMNMRPPKLGLQRVVYNMELAELDRGLVTDDGNLVPHHPTPNGGLLAVGLDESSKRTTLQYVDPNGRISSAVPLGVQGNIAFSNAAVGKTQMFLLSEQNGGRVFDLRYGAMGRPEPEPVQ